MTDRLTKDLCLFWGFFFSQNKREEKVKFCEPCLRKNLRKKRTHFCKTCEVPEALCKDCAQQHTREKLSRYHEVCKDTGKRQSVQQ